MASTSDLAARLPGELEMLVAIAANPGDDTTKLVYADWLEERGDLRGDFLRRFVVAAQHGDKLPSSADLPKGWLEIIGYSLINFVRATKRDEHRKAILANAKPALAITVYPCTQDEIPLGRSQFGGLPSLPRGTKWPRCTSGPLEFMAQLDLAELRRTVAGHSLPPTGLLCFFMYHDYDRGWYGASQREVPGGLRIIHTPEGCDLKRLAPPKDLDEDLGHPRLPAKITLADAMDLPDGYSIQEEPPDALLLPIVDKARHQLFGYPHASTFYPPPTPGPDWEQLIRFNSDRDLDWRWGDRHRLFWYIKSSDLRAGRFDETFAIDG